MISREGREFQRSFCSKLRCLIRNHNVKAHELAELLGVKNSTIYNWTSQKTDEEKSRQFPGISVVHKFMPVIDTMLAAHVQQATGATKVQQETETIEAESSESADPADATYPINLEEDKRFNGGMLEVAFRDRTIATTPRMAYNVQRGVVTGTKVLNKEDTVGDLLDVLGMKLIGVEAKIREQEAILEALRGEHATLANTIAIIRSV